MLGVGDGHTEVLGVGDGLLLVRLVSNNVSELTGAELLCALWSGHRVKGAELLCALWSRRGVTGAELLCALWSRHGATLDVDAPAGGDLKDARTQRLRRKHHQQLAAAHRDASRTTQLANDDDASVAVDRVELV